MRIAAAVVVAGIAVRGVGEEGKVTEVVATAMEESVTKEKPVTKEKAVGE